MNNLLIRLRLASALEQTSFLQIVNNWFNPLSRVASEISRNEISRNVSRNFYFAFREIL
jgi:hypothetical protein